jgi:hypothetical protein
MSGSQDGKLLPQGDIFQKKVTARTKETKSHSQQKPQRAKHESVVSRTSSLQSRLAVGFTAMMHATNFDGIGYGTYKEEPVIANPQPKLFSPLENLHVTRTGLRKAMQGGENVHGDRLAQVANIGSGRTSPNDPFHLAS